MANSSNDGDGPAPHSHHNSQKYQSPPDSTNKPPVYNDQNEPVSQLAAAGASSNDMVRDDSKDRAGKDAAEVEHHTRVLLARMNESIVEDFFRCCDACAQHMRGRLYSTFIWESQALEENAPESQGSGRALTEADIESLDKANGHFVGGLHHGNDSLEALMASDPNIRLAAISEDGPQLREDPWVMVTHLSAMGSWADSVHYNG